MIITGLILLFMCFCCCGCKYMAYVVLNRRFGIDFDENNHEVALSEEQVKKVMKKLIKE